MRAAERLAVLAAVLAAAVALPSAAAAQAPPQRPDTAAARRGPPPEIRLVYEREIFSYPAEGRRDPFAPPAQDDLGPRFEELALRGIIFSPAGTSVALLADGSGKIYRVKQGEFVGNARVMQIQPLRVVFEVEQFGAVRRELLELARPVSGGDGR